MPAARKSTTKRKPATRSASAKTTKRTTKKATAAKSRTTTRKTAAKKAPAKRATTPKTVAKKAPAKREPARKAAPKRKVVKNAVVKSKLTKTQILREIAERTEDLNQKQVALVFESLHELVQGAIKKGGCGEFAIPNIGVKIRRVKKKATKARWGRNPATGEQVWIKAKPARQVIKVTALKALKGAID